MSQGGTAPPGLSPTGSREVSMTIPVAPEMEIVATAQAAALGEYIAMPRDKIDEVKLALVEPASTVRARRLRDEQLHLTSGWARNPRGGSSGGGRSWTKQWVSTRGRRPPIWEALYDSP